MEVYNFEKRNNICHYLLQEFRKLSPATEAFKNIFAVCMDIVKDHSSQS